MNAEHHHDIDINNYLLKKERGKNTLTLFFA